MNYVMSFPIGHTVRLVGGQNQDEGLVEVFYNGDWGTVCDDDWDIDDAYVVCRQLGYSGRTVDAYSDAQFGEGCGIIWLDDVQCNGSESNLFDCPNNGPGIHNCSHSEDASITCKLSLLDAVTSDYSLSLNACYHGCIH